MSKEDDDIFKDMEDSISDIEHYMRATRRNRDAYFKEKEINVKLIEKISYQKMTIIILGAICFILGLLLLASLIAFGAL